MKRLLFRQHRYPGTRFGPGPLLKLGDSRTRFVSARERGGGIHEPGVGVRACMCQRARVLGVATNPQNRSDRALPLFWVRRTSSKGGEELLSIRPASRQASLLVIWLPVGPGWPACWLSGCLAGLPGSLAGELAGTPQDNYKTTTRQLQDNSQDNPQDNSKHLTKSTFRPEQSNN